MCAPACQHAPMSGVLPSLLALLILAAVDDSMAPTHRT